jgi:hypothetical protein
MIKPSLWVYCTLVAAGGLYSGAPSLAATPGPHSATAALQLAPATAIAQPAAAAQAKKPTASGTTQHKSQRAQTQRLTIGPLNFHLAHAHASLTAIPKRTPATPPDDSAANPAMAAFSAPLTVAVDAGADASNLFNRDNGLSGFMADNWVNPQFGFQGGLAIQSPRLREDNSGLKDDIAVGMGLLLAF